MYGSSSSSSSSLLVEDEDEEEEAARSRSRSSRRRGRVIFLRPTVWSGTLVPYNEETMVRAVVDVENERERTFVCCGTNIVGRWVVVG